MKMTPYNNLQDILATRIGGINELVSAGGAQGRADLSLAQSNASLLRQNYQDLLGEYQGRQAEEQARQAALAAEAAATEDKRRWELNYNLDKYKANKSGGSELGGLGGLLAGLFGGDTATASQNTGGQFTEPPYPSVRNASQQLEYPPGSGVIWSSDGNGGWE